MKWKKCISFLVFAILMTCAAQAQFVGKQNWQADWIGADTPSVPNTFHRYRNQVVLDELPAIVLASIATDSKYWLWVNGKQVVFEGGLKRGPTPLDTYYDEINLRPYLRKGRNTLAVLVWYWGKDGFSHKSSGRTGLLFELMGDGKNLLKNGGWKMAQHAAYGQSSAPHPNFRLAEHNIHYDARIGDDKWMLPDYNDASWKHAAVIAKAGEAPWNQLWKRPIPQWHNSGLQLYTNTWKNDTGKIVMQLPANLTVTPYFKIEAPAGLLIDVRTDNYNGGNAPNIRTEYITKAGVQEFESPAYFNGHQVVYQFPPNVKIIELKYRETRYNTKWAGSFQSNDSFLNKLRRMSATTLNLNMRDGIFDCPDRERAQWWGDIVINLEEIFYSCDAQAVPLIKKAISNLLEWQKDDGALFSPIPAGNWDKELPAQMLAAVGKYGIWKYIQYSGDTAMIRYAYPFVKKYMALWRLNSDGLVQHREGGWSWHDWGDKIDVPLLDNAWYYMALESCYNMAVHLGLNGEAMAYKQQMHILKAAFQKQFWKENHFASEGYPFFADDRGNGLAVCAGLVSTEQWQKLKPVLDTTYHAGPYLEKYILEAYFIMNDATAGIHRMKSRYAQMVNHPTITTLWEGWEIGSATYGGGTYNHGWTGGPLSLMSAYIAGIKAEDFGYKLYSIQPQLGNLTQVSAQALTPKGMVRVAVKKSAAQLVMQVETIAAQGVIAVPKSGFTKSRVAGNKRNGLRYFKSDADWFYFHCAEKGKWEIIVE